MSTPSTQDGSKNIRVSAEVHARLQRLIDTTGCKTHNEAVMLLTTPQVLRVPLPAEQRERWEQAAHEVGVPVEEFVRARVEAALHFGVDPGVLRRIHDMVYALTRAAGVIPQQATPGANRQTVTDPNPPSAR